MSMSRTKELLTELNNLRLKPKGLGPDAAVRRLERSVEILTELVEIEGTQQLNNALAEAKMNALATDRFYRRTNAQEEE
jgi:hypothetical protein